MSKPLIKLFDINHIQGNCIYLKDKRILSFYAITAGKNTTSKALETILSNSENPWHIITTKRNTSFEDFESYFSSLLTKNLTSPFLAELLTYIQNFKESCNSFSKRKMYLIVEAVKEIEGQNLTDLLFSYGFKMQILEERDIANLLQDICN